MTMFIGFYVFETGWALPHFTTKTLAWKCHHLVAILIFIEPLYHGIAGAEACYMIYAAEVTLPALLIGWFVRDAGYPSHVLIFEWIFLIQYYYYRIYVATPFLFQMLQHSKSGVIFETFSVFIYTIGLLILVQKTVATERHTRMFLKLQLK